MKKTEADWFNNKKYEPLRTMSLLQWFRQIQIRKSLYNCIVVGKNLENSSVNFWIDEVNNNFDEISVENLAGWISKIKKDPIFKAYDYPKLHTSAVRPLNVLDCYIHSIDPAISHVWQECEEKWNTFELEDKSLAYKSVDQLMFEQYGNSHGHDQCYFHLSIDPEATDSQLMNDFKIWLEQARSSYERHTSMTSATSNIIKSEFSEKDIREWCNDQLIQYLDLKIVFAYEGIKITNAQFGEILLEHLSGFTKGDTARKTIAKKSLHLISEGITNALAAQLRICP